MADDPGPEVRPKRTLGDLLFRVFLVIVFVAMVVELVLLAMQNRELKARLSELRAATERQTIDASLKHGEIVGPLALPSLGGEITEVTYDDPGLNTLLLVFSPDCPACEANMESWKRLEETIDAECMRLFYISTADEPSTRRFVEEQGLLAPVLLAGQQDLAGYKVSHIPMTIAVGSEGVVQRVWVGVMPDGAADELINTCGI